MVTRGMAAAALVTTLARVVAADIIVAINHRPAHVTAINKATPTTIIAAIEEKTEEGMTSEVATKAPRHQQIHRSIIRAAGNRLTTIVIISSNRGTIRSLRPSITIATVIEERTMAAVINSIGRDQVALRPDNNSKVTVEGTTISTVVVEAQIMLLTRVVHLPAATGTTADPPVSMTTIVVGIASLALMAAVVVIKEVAVVPVGGTTLDAITTGEVPLSSWLLAKAVVITETSRQRAAVEVDTLLGKGRQDREVGVEARVRTIQRRSTTPRMNEENTIGATQHSQP